MEATLRMLPYSSYPGIDFSIEALKQARSGMPSSCGLVCADMTDFETSRKFDIIVLPQARIGSHDFERLSQWFYFPFLHQNPGIAHNVRHAANLCRDDRFSRAHGFDQGISKLFFRRSG